MSETETPRERRTRRMREIPHLQIGDVRQVAAPAQPGVAAHTDFQSTTACGEEIASTLATRMTIHVRCPRCLAAWAAGLTAEDRGVALHDAEHRLASADDLMTPRTRQGLELQVAALREIQ